MGQQYSADKSTVSPLPSDKVPESGKDPSYHYHYHYHYHYDTATNGYPTSATSPYPLGSSGSDNNSSHHDDEDDTLNAISLKRGQDSDPAESALIPVKRIAAGDERLAGGSSSDSLLEMDGGESEGDLVLANPPGANGQDEVGLVNTKKYGILSDLDQKAITDGNPATPSDKGDVPANHVIDIDPTAPLLPTF